MGWDMHLPKQTMKRAPGLTTVLVVSLLAGVVAAQDGGGADSDTVVSRLRKTYDAELARIDASRKESIQLLRDKYLVSLDRLEKAMQEAGRLEVIMAVRKERERYKADKSLPAPGEDVDAPELASMCHNFVAAVRSEELDHARKTVTLAGQYERSLAALQERYTREGKYDAAIAVKNERGLAGGRPEVTAAEFTIADSEAEQRAEEAAAARLEDTAELPPATPARAYSGSAENYITKRYRQFRDAITAEDWKTAIGIVNPHVVRKRGEDVVKLQMQIALPFLKVAKALGAEVQPGSVTLYMNDARARLETRAWIDNRWRTGKPTFWTEVAGDWYIELKPPPAEEQPEGDDSPDQRRGPGERRGPFGERRGPPGRFRRP